MSVTYTTKSGLGTVLDQNPGKKYVTWKEPDRPSTGRFAYQEAAAAKALNEIIPVTQGQLSSAARQVMSATPSWDYWGGELTKDQADQLYALTGQNTDFNLGHDDDDSGFDLYLVKFLFLKGSFEVAMTACRRQATWRKNIRSYVVNLVRAYEEQNGEIDV